VIKPYFCLNYYSKRFTVYKIQYTCTIKHISRTDTMRLKFQIEKLVQIKKYIYTTYRVLKYAGIKKNKREIELR
jgi:hypothetical protein